jgi:hypothetical protein
MIAEGVQQVLTVLYPLYKEEVYRRREQMMKLTALGTAGLVLMLCGLLLSPRSPHLAPQEALLLGMASLVWCGLCSALIHQQQQRHRLAKQVLIQLEQMLGFYEDGLAAERRPMYPESWKTAWLHDRSGILYFSSLGLLEAIFLLALLLI